MAIVLRKATARDLSAITGLSLQLYGGRHDADELEAENRRLLRMRSQVVFLALRDGCAVGFAHGSIRTDYVEGTSSGRVGYLEGVYVQPEARRCGVAARLLGLCEDWARQRGCREFASDCLLANSGSIHFHQKTGFMEANRIVCWTKKL